MNLMNLSQPFENFLATNQIQAKKVHKTHKVHRGSVQTLIEAAGCRPPNCSGRVSYNKIKNTPEADTSGEKQTKGERK